MTTVPSDDSLLWARALEGDAESFGLLWDRHRDAVFRLALTVVRDRFDAEDVTAVAFLTAWRSRRRVRLVDGSLLPWMLVTCRNVARNHERSQRRYRSFLARIPAPPVVDPTTQVALRGEARAALDLLEPIDQQLLMLTAVEGLNLREAAEQLGLSHAAARARVSRARKKITTLPSDLEAI